MGTHEISARYRSKWQVGEPTLPSDRVFFRPTEVIFNAYKRSCTTEQSTRQQLAHHGFKLRM